MNSKLRVLDLFSGIGGFSLGLHSTGIFDTVKFVEIDKFCQKVLNKNFPGIPIEEDIKNVKGQEFEADVITGGFPCQPFSVAGKQKGTNDNRYLWPEMLRLIKEIKPEFVIGENVQGLINLQNGMVLRQVQDNLESEGFEVQCFLIPASGLGAWHQRYRVWIVGHSKYNGLLAAEKRSRDKKINGGTQEGQNQTIESERTSGSRNDEDVSNTTGSRSSSESIRNIRSLGEKSETKKTREGINLQFALRHAVQKEEKQKRMYPTPRSSGQENAETLIKRKGEKAAARHNLTANVQMFPTPSASCQMDVVAPPETVKQNSSGWSVTRVGTGTKFGAKVKRCSEQSKSTNQTWWQIESNLCGVPDGISYGLDKGRVNRIKSLR